MTKKHFELVAKAIEKQTRITIRNSELQPVREHAIRDIAEQLAMDFLTDNPRFDRERFLKACGLR